MSFSSMILYSDMFIPRDSPISLILSSSPTRIALAIPRSLATFTASRTAASCATATDRVLVLHSPTLERSSLKFLAILLSPSIMTASPLIHSKNGHMQTHITFYIIPPMGTNVKSRRLMMTSNVHATPLNSLTRIIANYPFKSYTIIKQFRSINYEEYT